MTNMATLKPSHFLWRVDGAVAVIQLNRPERKNPLTFESYAELRDTFRALPYADDIHAVVFLPNGGNFCSGGDVHEIIGPLAKMSMKELLAFTRMTGDLVKAMLHCGKPIISAIDGIAAGAGAIIAMASDLRIATPAGADRVPVQPRRPCRLRHGRLRDAAAHHRPRPRRRTALYRPRHDGARKASAGAFSTSSSPPRRWSRRRLGSRSRIAGGPTFANSITKTQFNQEWSMSLDQAIEAEAQAQASACRPKISNAPIARSSPSRSQCSRGIRVTDGAFSPGRSLKTATAHWRKTSSAGARRIFRSITPTSTPPAASLCKNSAATAG